MQNYNLPDCLEDVSYFAKKASYKFLLQKSFIKFLRVFSYSS